LARGAHLAEIRALDPERDHQRIVRRSIYALLDDEVIEAFGFPRPSGFARWSVAGALKARALGARLRPARRKPRLRTETKHRSHPEGYEIETLGPPSQAGHHP